MMNKRIAFVNNRLCSGARPGRGGVHKIINFYFYNDLFPCRDGQISIPLSSSYSGKVEKNPGVRLKY
jgi:hypothetical protein